jgi:hypothetical protein
MLIHDGALAFHEIVHELKLKKTRAVILKLDFEKAYDRVSWTFFFMIFWFIKDSNLGLFTTWCSWLREDNVTPTNL